MKSICEYVSFFCSMYVLLWSSKEALSKWIWSKEFDGIYSMKSIIMDSQNCYGCMERNRSIVRIHMWIVYFHKRIVEFYISPMMIEIFYIITNLHKSKKGMNHPWIPFMQIMKMSLKISGHSRITLIPTWISSHTNLDMWNNVWNGIAVQLWGWISNFIPHFTGHVITYPCWDQS